jgi:uncharacterized lipoprotein
MYRFRASAATGIQPSSSGGANRTRIHVVAGSALAVLLVLGVAACNSNAEQHQPTTPASRDSHAPATSPTTVPPDVPAPVQPSAPATSPQLSCGSLTVPDNQAKPNGGTVTICRGPAQ